MVVIWTTYRTFRINTLQISSVTICPRNPSLAAFCKGTAAHFLFPLFLFINNLGIFTTIGMFYEGCEKEYKLYNHKNKRLFFFKEKYAFFYLLSIFKFFSLANKTFRHSCDRNCSGYGNSYYHCHANYLVIHHNISNGKATK